MAIGDPPVIASWIAITQSFGIKGNALNWISVMLLFCYFISFFLILNFIGGINKHRELKNRIIIYLSEHEFRMASIERLASKSEINASEDQIAEIAEIFPETFRPATLKRGKSGLAFTDHYIESEKKANDA